MEPVIEVKDEQKLEETTKPVQDVDPKVENIPDTKTECPTPATKPSGRKRSLEREKDRSKDQQSVRERNRRGERSRGGDRVSKGSIYQPRSRPECCVHVSNIPYEYRWQDLKDLFRNEVGEVSFVELFEDEHGKPRGCGVVEFEKLEHARTALEKMNRFELKGRQLVVKEDSDVERYGYGRSVEESTSVRGLPKSRDMPPPRSSSRDFGSDDVGHGGMNYTSGSNIGTLASPSSTHWMNTYGLSPRFLDSLGISGPLYHRVFVANLDYKVDDAKLREVFRLAGKVVVAEVVKDRDGRSRGFGVVEMSHPIESVQAISMLNNQMLYDRRMTVRMDRDADRTETRSSRLPEGLRSIGMGLGTGGNPLHDIPRTGLMPPSANRHDTAPIIPASSSVGARPMSNDYSLSGVSGVGTSMDRSFSNFNTMGSSQSMSSSSLTDYRRTALQSNYDIPFGSGNQSSLNGLGGQDSSAYGYRTEILPSREGSYSNELNYERRDAYGDYRTNQLNRERQDYVTSTAYDSGNQMSVAGSSNPSLPAGAAGSLSRLSDTVAVTNLPLNYSWQDLRDKFCEVGDVLFADIRSKGTGIVRFSSERDAQRACSLLNRTRMEDHIIEVKFY